MLVNSNWTLKRIDPESLHHLVRCTGPCITIQVPDFRPGEQAGSRRVKLRDLTQTAEEELRKVHRHDGTELVCSALRRMVDSADGEGGPGFTIFCSPTAEEVFETPDVEERVAVGSRFYVLTMLREALSPVEIYAIGLNKKHIRLWRIAQGECKALTLPSGVPSNFDEAFNFDQPDHDLENRSSGGQTVGIRGVRFGTSTDRESAGEYLHHFFRLVANGLKPTIKNAPVFLIGVHEEIVEFRRAAKGERILETEFHANPEHCSTDQILTRAVEAGKREWRNAAVTALRSLSEVKEKIIGDAPAILKAAMEGRILRLFIGDGTRFLVAKGSENLYEGEDLINAAAVEALRTSAQVFAVPPDLLPEGALIAAEFRY